VAASAPAFRPVVKAARPQPAGTGWFCCWMCWRRTLVGLRRPARRAPDAVTSRRRSA